MTELRRISHQGMEQREDSSIQIQLAKNFIDALSNQDITMGNSYYFVWSVVSGVKDLKSIWKFAIGLGVEYQDSEMRESDLQWKQKKTDGMARWAIMRV